MKNVRTFTVLVAMTKGIDITGGYMFKKDRSGPEEGRRKTASASAQELTRALELRRVGIDHNSQAMADADATELQGDGVALGGMPQEEKKTEDRREEQSVSRHWERWRPRRHLTT